MLETRGKQKIGPLRIYRAPPPDLSGPSGNRRSGTSGSIGPLQKQKIGPLQIYGVPPETEDRAQIYRAPPETEDWAPPDLSGPSGNRRSGPSGSIGPLHGGTLRIYRTPPETEDQALPDLSGPSGNRRSGPINKT